MDFSFANLCLISLFVPLRLPFCGFRSSASFFLAVVLIAGFMSASHALTVGEAAAMNELVRVFPHFATSPVGALKVEEDTAWSCDLWPSSFSTTTAMPDGCLWYGFETTGTGIERITIDVLWARAVDASALVTLNSATLSGLSNLQIITYNIPDAAEDEQILAPLISALFRALSTTQVIELSVLKIPTVLQSGSFNIYDPVWTWTGLISIYLEVEPTVFPMVCDGILYLSVKASNMSVIPPAAYGNLYSLGLYDRTVGVRPADMPFAIRSALTQVSAFTVVLPPDLTVLTNGWRVTMSQMPALSALRIIGHDEYV